MGQHLSDAPRDIAILTFDLAGDGPSRRYGSSSSLWTPSLKFVDTRYNALPVSTLCWPGDLDHGGHGACSWCVGLPVRKIGYCAFTVWALIGLMVLKLMRNIAIGVSNLPTDFGVSRSFCFRLIDQQLPDASCDLSTLTFDLGGHGAWRRCGSSSSVCTLSLKFVGLSVRKIMSAGRLWPLTFDLETVAHYCFVCIPSLNFVGLPFRKTLRIYCVRIHRPGDLDLWPLTLKLLRVIARRMDNLSTNFGVSRSFCSRLIGQQLSDTSRDLSTLTFDLGGNSACHWCGSSCSVSVPSLKFVGLSVWKIWRTSGLNIMSAW